MGWVWDGMGWDLCAGLFYEHRFAMLIRPKVLRHYLFLKEDAISDVEKPSEDESSLAKKMNDLNELLDEEGRDEDEEKRNPLLLAWKRERVKENWSKVRNCMRDFIV